MPTEEEKLNLDKSAAEHAQKIVFDVREDAGRVAEESARRTHKSPEETEKQKSALRQKRTEILERLTMKTLGVLQEQGVYAMMLFLFSRSSDEQKVAPYIRNQLYDAAKEIPGLEGLEFRNNAENDLKLYINNVLNDLDTLLLVRDLYEQTLIYARYGAKAADETPFGG